MFGLTIDIEDRTKKLEEAAEKAAYENFGHAAASIRKAAQKSIVRSKKPSDEGQPPHTRKGQLRRAIVYHRDKYGALIGPRHSIVGESGAAHEFGGQYRGGKFPERPYMGPALEKSLARIASDWTHSIGE